MLAELGFVGEPLEDLVDLVELGLKLAGTSELHVELMTNAEKLIVKHRQDVGSLHLWTRRSGCATLPRCTTLAGCATLPGVTPRTRCTTITGCALGTRCTALPGSASQTAGTS
jgi:hypothetical protein